LNTLVAKCWQLTNVLYTGKFITYYFASSIKLSKGTLFTGNFVETIILSGSSVYI